MELGTSAAPEGVKASRQLWTAHPDVIPLLEQAAACPDYDAQLDYALSPEQFIAKMLPEHAGIRVLTCVCCNSGLGLLVAEGNYDEAVRTALVIFRLAHHCERNPTIVGYLVAVTLQGIAVDSANAVLQAGPVSKEVRDALDAELARLTSRMDGLRTGTQSERVHRHGRLPIESIPGRNFWLIARG